jgi:imidazolonepropionase-like amidohydrolase
MGGGNMTATLFKNVRIIDGNGKKPFAGEVLVEGNRIKRIARAGKTVKAPGARVVDGGGQTLMPGLVEAHAHISFCNTPDLETLGDMPPEEHTLESMKFAKVMLDQGFTSLFSAAAAKPRLDIVIRNAIDAGALAMSVCATCTARPSPWCATAPMSSAARRGRWSARASIPSR